MSPKASEKRNQALAVRSSGLRTKPQVAFSWEGEPAGLPAFIEGLREGGAGSGILWVAHAGGPETLLDALRQGIRLQGVIGGFAGGGWLGSGQEGPPPRVVNLEALSRIEGVCAVGVDWWEAGRLAWEVLRDAGVASLGFAGVRGQFASRQLLGGLSEAASGNISAVSEVPIQPGSWAHWLRESPRPIGVLCATPSSALRLVQATQAAGLTVPDAIKILAIGDTALASIQGGLELSSLPIPWRALGHEAARLMTGLLSGGLAEPVSRLIPAGAPLLRASSSPPAGRHAGLEEVIRQLPEWLEDNPSVEDLARRAGMSRRLFELRFREQTGRSPYQEMQAMRLDKARHLLETTSLAASAIGQLCGYREPQVFSSAFKRSCGCSPLGWRQGKATRSVGLSM